MRIFLIGIFIILPLKLFGQNDSLLYEILNYRDSTSELISKARALLIKNFNDGDFDKVREIKNYLKNEVRDRDYEIFSPREYQLLLYWTREFSELTANLYTVDLTEDRKNIKPPPDLLYDKLLEKTNQSLPYMESTIRKSGLPDIKKDFLLLNLRYLSCGEDFPMVIQDKLNDLADQFLAKYTNQPRFEYYVRKNIRFKFIPAKWGYGVGMFSGYEIFTGSLGTYYQNNIPIGMSVDFNHQKILLSTRFSAGFSRTKKDIPCDNITWPKGSSARMLNMEASFGYIYSDTRNRRIIFFSGIGVASLGPQQYDIDKIPKLKKADMTSVCFSLGISYDVKLGKSLFQIVQVEPKETYTYLRFRYAYYLPQFQWKHDGYNGSLQSLTIELGGFERRIVHDY